MGKALVIRGGALGDFVLTLPAIRLLAEALEDTEVHVLGYSPMIQLEELAGLAVETRRIEHAPLARFFVPGADLDPTWKAYFASFDVILSYLHDPENIFHDNLLRAGAKPANIYPAIHKVVDDPSSGHAVHQLAQPLEALALYLVHPAPTLSLPPKTRAGIAIHPGSGAVWKNWPTNRWIDLLPKLGKMLKPNEKIAIISGEAEEAWIDDFVAEARHAKVPLDLWRNPSLTDLANQLNSTRGFIGHDTGISHLAAAAGTPSLVLFGATNPDVWAPRGEHVQILRSKDDRLLSITHEEVAAQFSNVLNAD